MTTTEYTFGDYNVSLALEEDAPLGKLDDLHICHLGMKFISARQIPEFNVYEFEMAMRPVTGGEAVKALGEGSLEDSVTAVCDRLGIPDAAARARALGVWAVGGAVAAAAGPLLGQLIQCLGEIAVWRCGAHAISFFAMFQVAACALPTSDGSILS